MFRLFHWLLKLMSWPANQVQCKRGLSRTRNNNRHPMPCRPRPLFNSPFVNVQVGCCGIWKKKRKPIPEKNTDNADISVFFRDCILLNFMQNLLNLMQNFLFSNDAKQPRYNSFDSSGAWYFQRSVRPVISSLWNVRFRNWKCIAFTIDYRTG
jgi:hypothetical protein